MSEDNTEQETEEFIESLFSKAQRRIPLGLASDPSGTAYQGMTFSVYDKQVIYRKAKITAERPGAFLSLWQRPYATKTTSHKPVPLTAASLDYLLVHVEEMSNLEASAGLFVFPSEVLLKRGILASDERKGKTGFRVFPPWSRSRGQIKTQVFSKSGQLTQRWQQPYFVELPAAQEPSAKQLQRLLHALQVE